MMKVLRLVATTIGLLVLLLPLTGALRPANAHVATASVSWSLTGSMKHARVYNTMTLLANGQANVGDENNQCDGTERKWTSISAGHVASLRVR